MTERQRKNQAGRRATWLRILICLSLLLSLGWSLRHGAAQSGVLIPSTGTKPDAATLSLQVMNVDVLIDNQHARVRVLQIFDSHVPQQLEGKYVFALPPQASISDFAVWDGDTRIPGVMMEKRRANAVYSQIKQQQVDPGLLQQDDEHAGKSAFSAKVFPIPAYGTKRVEMEYTEMLPVDSLTSHFTFPLKPSFGDPQRVEEFNLHLHILSDYPISPIVQPAGNYPLKVTKSGASEFEGDFQTRALELKEDFAFDYGLNVPGSALSFIAYRAPEQISAYDLRDPSLASQNPDGYFEARALFHQQSAANSPQAAPRNVILLLDTSLSMYGEKLTKAVEATDYFLHSLSPQDQFDLILFNEEASALSPAPLPATPQNVERALEFIKASMLGGGTDLRIALAKSVEVAAGFPVGEKSIVLISDVNPTLGTRNLKQIVQVLDQTNAKKNGVSPPRVFAFGLGSDANTALLEALAATGHGYFARARETEDIATALKIFFEHVGKLSIEGLRLTPPDRSNFYQVYAAGDYSFEGSSLAFVGRYRKPAPQTTIGVHGQYGTKAIDLSRNVSLPEFAETHGHLPRLWARARVDALLREMDMNGEREDYIAEIIRLSEKYKFVTPYTAFIAAPRALLRPRLIQPGDPVLRVKTDESIKSVFVVLPFGETLPLKFLSGEGVWEVRFLAPAWMPDGSYRCRLLLTDKNGNGYQEEKSFVIDSHAPKLKAQVDSQIVRAGDELLIRCGADSDTDRLVAKMYGAQPVQLFWSSREQTNVGRLRVPAGLAAGKYTVVISAEDFAHNQSSAEIQIEVLPRW
ncbi:MAG TPA: VIT and VWA domain-containing protein [Pyrinomonadaceae bacterium]|nr:VIT and VWA domain-containing protein [Pyrinomonadaceae bacterium]